MGCNDAIISEIKQNPLPEKMMDWINNSANHGFSTGDIVQTFSAYDLDLCPVNLDELLKNGRPVLLVSGSYTCNIYRKNNDALQDLFEDFKNDIDVYVIYVMEAHPTAGFKPYTERNPVEYPHTEQAATLNERSMNALRLKKDIITKPEILLDNPENHWWKNSGYGPNAAVLISDKGKVLLRQDWFMPEDMRAYLSYYLKR